METSQSTQTPEYPKSVTPAFLREVAQRIHDPKTGEYLRLCTGTLKSSHHEDGDESNPQVIHCGLGELYYAVTGEHPNRFQGIPNTVQRIIKATTSMNPRCATQVVRESSRQSALRNKYRNTLKSIVTVNDNPLELAKYEETRIDDGIASIEHTYLSRAQRVASVLLDAAATLARYERNH